MSYRSVLKYLLLSPTRNCVSLGLCFLIWEAGKVRLEKLFSNGSRRPGPRRCRSEWPGLGGGALNHFLLGHLPTSTHPKTVGVSPGPPWPLLKYHQRRPSGAAEQNKAWASVMPVLCDLTLLILRTLVWHVRPVKSLRGPSLLARWLRIHCAMQGTRVRAPVRELRSHMLQSNC